MEKYQKLNDESQSYIDLWKWLNEDAAKIKERMWVMSTFFYTVLAGLFGFIVKHVLEDKDSFFINILNSVPLILLVSIIGILMSVYATYMLVQYENHIQAGWRRANYIRRNIEDLNEIWCAGYVQENKKKQLNFAERLILITKVFVIIFVAIFIISALYVFS